MQMKLHQQVLRLAHPFTIARGSIDQQLSLVVELEQDSLSGFGEVTANTYYGHTLESMEQHLRMLEPRLQEYGGQPIETVWEDARRVMRGDHFALSAFDMAFHDLLSRQEGKPLYQQWELAWNHVPVSSYTIGIDSLEQMIHKLRERSDWSIYKIKLGTDRDLEIVRALRQETDATFRVDANCGWSADQAIEISAELADLGVEFIEQPLPPESSREEQERLYRESALPIIADESCQTEPDVSRCVGAFHGINVKLCKCGGLTPALRMLREARSVGLKTMVGCMIESSIGISGAAHLLPLLDFADLDGAILLQHDPAEGVQIDRGRVTLADANGTGAQL